MPNFELLFSAQLTNVKEILPPNTDTDWFIKVQCTSCGEIHEKFVSVNSEERIPTMNSRNSVNMCLKCKFCGRELTSDIVADSVKPYTGDDSGQLRPIVRFSCSGLVPIEFSIRDGWQVTSSSPSETVFSDVDLSSGEWVGFDENSDVCLEIMEIETQFKLTK
ncbi:unnamed protein product [Rodentolepis nana]|uniref:UPF0587 protein n=1 Tax=Rodentolepis nana TaxID=102285 RepID=A0A0R3T9B4_RODNA|nr:unnamed protein product [Rodentolepis nana]